MYHTQNEYESSFCCDVGGRTSKGSKPFSIAFIQRAEAAGAPTVSLHVGHHVHGAVTLCLPEIAVLSHILTNLSLRCTSATRTLTVKVHEPGGGVTVPPVGPEIAVVVSVLAVISYRGLGGGARFLGGGGAWFVGDDIFVITLPEGVVRVLRRAVTLTILGLEPPTGALYSFTLVVTAVHQVGQFDVLEAEPKGVTDDILVLGVLGPYRYHPIGGKSLSTVVHNAPVIILHVVIVDFGMR